MASPSHLQAAILYQNPVKTITLMDIPRSISLAQGTPLHPCNDQILSSPAIQQPYPSTEPKSETAKANVLRMKAGKNANAEFPEELLLQAVQEISVNHKDRSWCLERKVSPFAMKIKHRKRKRREESTQPIGGNVLSLSQQSREASPGSMLERVERLGKPPSREFDIVDLSTCVENNSNSYSSIKHIANQLCHNPMLSPMLLQCEEPSSNAPERYILPPQAHFILSKINQATAPTFSMAAVSIYAEASTTAGRGQFDFILLDPPWKNRSVRRSAKYDTMRDPEPMEVLHNMLGQHITPGGLVTCWITNNASVREAALEAFQVWDVCLLEEWAWLKVTANGAPVTAIDGVWRKPYEILLVGRKHDQKASEHGNRVVRRVIAAVPDFHSRKPNLKTLVAPLLPVSYRALEIFARNLTTGWWAWGDEVLRFAWDGHWSRGEEPVLI